MEPKLVESTPPHFRVRRIVHGDAADLEAALNQGAEDGYEYSEILPVANGDLVLVFELESEAEEA